MIPVWYYHCRVRRKPITPHVESTNAIAMHSRILIVGLFVVFTCVHANAQTAQYMSANTPHEKTLSFNLSGGAFKSYGCKPIDPTYWIAGAGATVTVTFDSPEANPSFRVWGMNTDDMATVSVNGVAYPLTSSSASYAPKVVCGTSPGPNGVLFSDGNLVGANTPGEANFSYQDIQIKSVNVTSITVTGVKGAGWGFAGVSVYHASTASPSDTQPLAVPSATQPLTVPSGTKPQNDRETPRPER